MKLNSISKIKFKDGIFVKNIGWGVLLNIFQNVFNSIFFIVVAREFNTSEFSNYIIANNLYGLVLSFSSLGLGQWFLREIQIEKDYQTLCNKYLKIQFLIGILFYLINILICYSIYENEMIIRLSIILGVNIILDNILNVFKFININTSRQYYTFLFLSSEAIFKFLCAILLLLYGLGMFPLIIITVGIKIIVVIVFFRNGLPLHINTHSFIKTKVKIKEVFQLIRKNISFAIIGTMSVLFWGIGNLIVSKYLTINDVAYYDIIFKLFTMAQIMPVIFSITVFPLLVTGEIKGKNELKSIVNRYYWLYLIYGITSYVAVYSYIDYIIPNLFGTKYTEAVLYCKEMFLTMIIFPIVLLQANLLISIKKESVDMWMNIVVLFVNTITSMWGILYYKSLTTINNSVFLSFLLFLVMQDIYITKIKLKNKKDISNQYLIIGSVIMFCYLSSKYINIYFIFPVFVIILITILVINKYLFGDVKPNLLKLK